MSSIFVQMPSYSDYELVNTINDLLEKSSNNNTINIGIYLCYYNDSKNIKVPSMKNVKVKEGVAPEGIGLGYARLQSHNFYDGEDYYLQIDSHSKMNKDWDEQLISYVKEYQQMGFEKPLISTYPRNYTYQDDGSIVYDDNDLVTQISFHENLDSFKNFRLPSQTAVDNTQGNIFSNSVSGGSIFTVGEFIRPNPKIAFYGEEIFTAARAFTNGYDLLLPKKQFMYHLYYDHKRFLASKRRLVWKDWPNEFEVLDAISKKEIYDTLVNNIIGPEHLGNQRTLQEYGMRCGLDFKLGQVVSC